MDMQGFFTHSIRQSPWGDRVVQILAAALEAADPYRAVARALRLESDQLIVGSRAYPLPQIHRIYVVGAGKAGLPMAQAAIEVLGERLDAGIVIVKEGYGSQAKIGPVHIREASHPLPDERGLQATREMLGLLSQTTEQDLVIVLLSGGGSALLTLPVEGVTLTDLRAFTDILLASGASIDEINILRKKLDRVKGGGLAAAALPAQVVSLILSDVVGDRLEMIASGPTIIDQASASQIASLIEKYHLAERVPPMVLQALLSPAKLFSPHLAQVDHILVGNNEMAARASLAWAEAFGLSTQLLTTTLQGEASQVGKEMGHILRQLAAGRRPALAVAGGETTVTVRGIGLGGRNQELALAAVVPLAGLPDIALITIATDGGDGPTDAAGAVVTGETLARAQALGLSPSTYLANNDSYTFFSALGDCLRPGPTLTNVSDLVFMFTF